MSHYGRSFLFLASCVALSALTAHARPVDKFGLTGFQPSVYLGAQFGWGDLHYNENDLNVTVFIKRNNHIGARGYIGYSFTPYFSLESGFMYISDVHFFNLNVPSSGFNVRFQQYMIDLLGKISTPLYGHWGAFIKVGTTYVHHRADKTLGGMNFGGFPNRVEKFVATGAFGFDYILNRHIKADITWQHSFSRGVIDQMDLVAVGLNYHFA